MLARLSLIAIATTPAFKNYFFITCYNLIPITRAKTINSVSFPVSSITLFS